MNDQRIHFVELDDNGQETGRPIAPPVEPAPEPELLDAPHSLVHSTEPTTYKDMTISDLSEALRRDGAHKVDEIATVDAIAATVSQSGDFRVLFQPEGSAGPMEYRPTQTAVGQFSQRAGVPPAVTTGMMELGHNDLAAEGINRGIIKINEGNSDKSFLIRRRENGDRSVRAILSDQYVPIDTDLLTGTIAELLTEQSTGSRVERLHWDGDNFRAHVSFPDTDFDVPHDSRYRLGFTMTNNEVGGGSVSFNAMVWRLVCVNGLMAQRSIGGFRQIHRGQYDEHDLKRDIARTIEKALPASKELADRLVAAQEVPIPNIAQVIAQLSIDNRLSKSDARHWFAGYDQEALASRVAGGTAFGVVNGLTRSSRTANADRANSLEQTAGKLLYRTNWRTTSERATELDQEVVYEYVGVA